MDIWGLCPTCALWFPCEGWFDRNAPEPSCPVCFEAPRAIENRAITIRLPEVRIPALPPSAT